MRPLKKYFAIALSLGLFVNVSAQEYDDMYFTKKDRKSKFTNETYNETSSFASAEVEPVKITKQEDLAMNSYSAKTINPDYIAKYKVMPWMRVQTLLLRKNIMLSSSRLQRQMPPLHR
jgi:hypothetical protein